MRVNPQEALAESDKTSNVEQSVGRKVMKLKAIDEKEAPEKFMRGERKTSKKECKESNRPPRLRNRSYLLAWKFDLGIPQEAIAAQGAEVSWSD